MYFSVYTLGFSAVVSYTRNLIILFSVVYYVVRAVQKFYSCLVINWKRNKWKPV